MGRVAFRDFPGPGGPKVSTDQPTPATAAAVGFRGKMPLWPRAGKVATNGAPSGPIGLRDGLAWGV